jgi:catechol 2,3-dioxygenase-like lactoylglutathione lyase family enzyme
MDMKLEVVVIPVSDVERAAQFYRKLGWRQDADVGQGDGRLLQFTPPGSQCSVFVRKGNPPSIPAHPSTRTSSSTTSWRRARTW